MKRIMTMVTTAGLLAGALMLPAMSRAEGKPESHGEQGGKENFLERMREKFGISEEQGAQLKAAHRAKRDVSAASMGEISTLMRKLEDQLEDKAPEKDLAATLDKIVVARRAMRASAEKFEASLTSILTPIQRAKMLVARKEHGHRMRGGPEHGDDD
ncbi:MAG: hypothetical protein AAB268_12115 [Elusimicrobiota bacterium]